jgi:ComEC/Rec2-related protein
VTIADILESKPRRFSLPIAAAFGMALGFYPGPAFSSRAFVLAAAVASFGLSLQCLESRAAGLRRMQAIALALGLAAGATVAREEAGRAPPEAPVRATAVERGGVKLSPCWAEGRLSSDSSPAKGGFRSYPLRLERLGLAGPGISAELSYPGAGRRGELRVLSRAGPEIDSGSLLRVRGAFVGPSLRGAAGQIAAGAANAAVKAGGGALFAQSRDILILSRGSAIDRARSTVRDACRRALARIGTRSAGLLQALILGVRDSLAPDEAEAFKAAGCSHILALSGEHLSVLALLAIAALRPLVGPVRARLGGAVVASLFMWVAGPGPSLVRAVLMVWIGAVALAFDRPQLWLTSLALAFLAMVPLDPTGARSLSFTLSYLAVWGLAVLGPRFSFLLGRSLPPFLRESASASLSAQAAVSPLLAFSFGYLQFAGILASMAAGPIVTATMWWGMGAGLLCSLLPFAAPFALPISNCLYDILMGIMKAAASVPPLPLPSPAARILASVAVAALAALVYARPYAEYRARLRFAQVPPGPPRRRRLGHVQALRPELSRE